MTLFSYGDASVILAGAAFLLAALAGVWLTHLVSVEVRRRGLAKVLLFVALSAPVAFWAGGKGGGDRSQGHDVVRDGQSESPLSGVVSQPRTIPGVTLRLPDSCDVGDGEGFFGLPCVSNLMIAAVVRGSNETASVVAWPYSARPLGDVVDFYAGTNLHALAKIFSLDVSACASNALVSVADEEVSGTNCNASAFFSVGDATDTDGDGLSDSDERLLYKTNPAIVDTDGDGLDDGREVVLGTNPLAIDTDGDGLDDEEESGGLVVGRGDHTSNASYVVTNLTAALEANPDWCVNVEISPVTVLGEVYHRIAVDMNGLLYLRNDTTVDPAQPYNGVVRSVRPSGEAYVVAPYWDRLSFSTNAPASVVTVGTWDEMPVVKFENMRVADASDPESCLMSVKVVLPTTPFPFFGFIYEPMSVEVAGRAAGVGVRSPDGRFCASDTICGLELDTGYNIVYVYPGYGTNPLSPDTDGDGLEDGYEVAVGTSPIYVDTDRDGLPDDWELSYGLDPLSNSGDDGALGDGDSDGLPNIGEYRNDTDPWNPDSDNGGGNDAVEVAQGTDPNDGSDDFTPPVVANFREISFNINGDYAAWEMFIEGLGPHDTRVRRISMGAPNAPNTTTFRMRKGNSYRLSMRWLNCDGHDDRCTPWYCWRAQIDGLPGTRTFNDYSAVRLGGNEVVAGNGWIADNTDGLLTSHVHQSAYDYYGNPMPGNVARGLTATLYVLDDPVIVFDYDRDGAITDAEAEIARAGTKTFRFWVNDDGDTGDINGPDDDIPGAGSDYADDHVNGRSDILDFTPVWVDRRNVFPMDAPATIRNALTWKVRSGCMNVMWTDLSREQAGLFHRTSLGFHFGTYTVLDMVDASVTNVSNGVEMPVQVVASMCESQECGVFLVEGCAYGTDLVVEGWTAGGGRKVVSGEANVRISSVEDMYRHLNTRNLSGETLTWNPYVGEPTNSPDSETSCTNLVFLHGANVTQQRARGWSAEVFKRMWQSGMTSKFTAVTWRSDIGLDWNYQENVSNAFFTASVLAPQISALPGTKVLMAHSLGNMVCSSMIQDYELVPYCYLMCNSAVPAEAYDTDQSLRVPQLVHSEWEEYPTNSWASSWHWLFRDEPNDDRKHLGWPGRFSNVAQYAVNFYSTGDEVLELASNNNIHSWTGISDSWGHFSWHKQELFKGRGGIGGTDWAGWNIAENWLGVNKISVVEAQTMTEADFRTNTVFYCYPPSMNSTNINLLVRGAHLAQWIPALTPAAGRIRFGDTKLRNQSFDCDAHLQIARPNGWPERSGYQGQWCHSDLKDVAYFFNFKFYEKAIEKGNLK